jgi:KDO2-lipid IV(A) lauroyltransferase
MPSPLDYVTYGALRGAIGALRLMPFARAVSAGGSVARLAYRPLGIRRQVVESQIALAFPAWDRAAVVRVARGAYEHLGRTTVETALVPSLARAAVLALVDNAEDWSYLEAARAESRGQGLVLITGHLGNWELAAMYLAARGLPMDVIARRMANPIFDRYLTRSRERAGLTVLTDAEAVRRVPRSVRDGRGVGFVADQGVKGMASTFVPFFGRWAKTPRGPAVFALRLGVPALFVTLVRLPSGRFRLVVEPIAVEETGDRERDVDVVVARYTAVLERWVREYPEQYFWHHRRWRRQPTEEEIERAEKVARIE